MAGAYGSAERLHEALAGGAAGVQVGTPFAFCNESALDEEIKHEVLRQAMQGTAEVRTDPKASPTGFPFKVVSLESAITAFEHYRQRLRVCDLGFLRSPFRLADGQVGFRCPAGPVQAFTAMGGKIEETFNRICLCNGLLAGIGLGQWRRDGYLEKPLVTAGTFLKDLARFVQDKTTLTYSARDVVNQLLAELGVAEKTTA